MYKSLKYFVAKAVHLGRVEIIRDLLKKSNFIVLIYPSVLEKCKKTFTCIC